MKFELVSEFSPKGSQPEAIRKLVDGIKKGKNFQTLLGVTGSGKTYTMANVIEKIQKPTLVIAHNKTLALQLYNEFKEFFPKNRVEFFVSYYDYYQPESYIPSRDLYIEKDIQINPKLDQMRLSATSSVISREDVIIIASVSCIYSVGNPQYYKELGFEIKKGQEISRRDLMKKLIAIQYERNDTELMPGRFRVKGDTVDIVPGYYNNIIRIEMFGSEIDRISELDKVTGNVVDKFDYIHIYPARHFVIPEDKIQKAIENIKKDLEKRLVELDPMEAHRLRQRTNYDIEMIEHIGYCKGIENYSVYFEDRKHGTKAYSLLDYFDDDFLIFIDESHQMIPQLHGMYKGDFSRKKNLVQYGFRLPSAFDNRPLKFHEFEDYIEANSTVFVSATPGDYEIQKSNQIVEQIIRPTGLIDPEITIRPTLGQIDDLRDEINITIKKGNRVLITTLTKRLAEELTEYLAVQGFSSRYLHSEIDTLERTEIIRQLRAGEYDVLVGINLLREGLDIPEVGFIAILDADKKGFLRDTRSLIQIIGRAARNVDSKIIMYADENTDSMQKAIAETKRRREIQIKYNELNGIIPKTIIKPVKHKTEDIKDIKHIPKAVIPDYIEEFSEKMREYADGLDFEKAIAFRDKIRKLKKRLKESKT
ncbi:excinuclease ABC subunit UvrB [bacterium]|nr:excinuclease ABC subunit UvrB [bacterium]